MQICIFRSSWDWPRESNLHKILMLAENLGSTPPGGRAGQASQEGAEVNHALISYLHWDYGVSGADNQTLPFTTQFTLIPLDPTTFSTFSHITLISHKLCEHLILTWSTIQGCWKTIIHEDLYLEFEPLVKRISLATCGCEKMSFYQALTIWGWEKTIISEES